MDELLKGIYYDPKQGFQSEAQLYRKAKEQDPKITQKIVKEFIQAQATSQITKQVKRTKNEYSTIQSFAKLNNFQIDLFFLPYPKLNENYKYLLTCIDVYSRFVFVEKLKTKTGQEVFAAVEKIFETSGIPKNINLDLGSEYIYKPFTDYCENHDITLWFSNPEQDNKNSIIERFHRTLRNLLLKFTVHFGSSYIRNLDDLVENYNNSYHTTIKATPAKIWNGDDINKQKIKTTNYNFVLGDRVRHLVDKNTFVKKSSTESFTKKIFTITQIRGESYYLDDLEKPFRGHELVVAVGDSKESDYDRKIEEVRKEKQAERKLNREGVKDYLGAGRYYL